MPTPSGNGQTWTLHDDYISVSENLNRQTVWKVEVAAGSSTGTTTISPLPQSMAAINYGVVEVQNTFGSGCTYTAVDSDFHDTGSAANFGETLSLHDPVNNATFMAYFATSSGAISATPNQTTILDTGHPTASNPDFILQYAVSPPVASMSVKSTGNFEYQQGCSFEIQGAVPVINTQPTSETGYTGQTVTFSVTATSSGGALSYQWQQFVSGSWTNVGTNASSYTTGTLTFSDNGDEFRVEVSDSNGTVNSNAVFAIVIGTASLAWVIN